MRYNSCARSGFTLIEMLVVIGVIGVLLAIIFPVYSHAREKARESNCPSNERQLAMAILQYTQDSNDTYPWSDNADVRPGGGIPTWPSLVNPFLGQQSQGQILVCPDFIPSITTLGYSTNSQVIGLESDDTGMGENFYQSTVSASRITEPDKIVLLGDANASQLIGPGDPTAQASHEYAYPHPALMEDHTNDPAGGADWVVPNTDGNNDKQIAWWHTGRANFAFCDGHAKWFLRGQLTDANWDVRCKPGVGCTGHPYPPNPTDYPAVSAACNNESALDCD